MSFLSDYALKQVSNFSLSQEQQSDGRYRVTLSAPSWSAGQALAAGSSLSPYYQGSGDLSGQTPLSFDTGDATSPAEPATSTTLTLGKPPILGKQPSRLNRPIPKPP